jgi:hypothetical protein
VNRQVHANAAPRRRRYPPRRERLGEWAAAGVTLLAAGLWLLWPRVPAATARPRRLPEAGAAYVNLISSGSPLALRPDRFTHGAGDERRIEKVLPLTLQPAPPLIPPPLPYLEPTGPLVATAARAPLPPAPPPPVAGPAPSPDWRILPPAAPAATVQLSPDLRRAQFQFEPPPAAVTNVAGRAAFRVVLGDDGRVAHVLDEESTDVAMARLWRAALLRGRGRANAAGGVAIEWRADGK